MPARVLIVDDEPDAVENCLRILRPHGHQCLTTTDPLAALGLLETEHPDVLVTDLEMSGVSGTELLRRARDVDPALPTVVITAFGTIASAVAAMHQGAFDYLPKPFSAEQLRVAVDRAARHRALQLENQILRQRVHETFAFDSIIGHSPAMTQLFDLVRRAARSEANILIVGESGTGKELIARAIHANSGRISKPFVPVDCASLPEPLLESELFGHEKGAFTGAIKTKPGLLEMAGAGTLFLDEIGELPLALQSKFLRVLQEHQVRRVGGMKLIDLDLRLVSATNRDLRQAILHGQFREELYYRINVVTIELPPLRARHGDVRLLGYAFLRKYGQDRLTRIDDDAMAALEAYGWPGNVRELQNVIERACALAEGNTVRRCDLPDDVLHRRHEPASAPPSTQDAPPAAPISLKEAKERWKTELEGAYLRDVLARHDGNVSAASRKAGIDRKTFHRLINRYRLR